MLQEKLQMQRTFSCRMRMHEYQYDRIELDDTQAKCMLGETSNR